MDRRKFMILKPVFTWSKLEKKFRLFRITYSRQMKQITLGLQPRLLEIEQKCGCGALYSVKVWFLGIVFHWHCSWGGYFPD